MKIWKKNYSKSRLSLSYKPVKSYKKFIWLKWFSFLPFPFNLVYLLKPRHQASLSLYPKPANMLAHFNKHMDNWSNTASQFLDLFVASDFYF